MKLRITYRQVTAIIFFVAFLAQTFSKSFVMADYYTNTSKYARNCENKARPQMHCNGKCQMMKKLQQEEKKDQKNPDRKNENKNEIILSSKSFFVIVNKTYNVTGAKKLYPQMANNYSFNCTNYVFHPPKG